MTRRDCEFDPQQPDAEMLLRAYRHSIFPMADPVSGAIDWFLPRERGIIPLEAFHVPRSLARLLRRSPFEIRVDTAFEQVMRACAEPRGAGNPTWINDTLIDAYCDLHRMGHAHSVEAWRDGTLVGGLYGVHIGAAFFGESMFSRPERGTDASKACLVALVERLRRGGFRLLDTQFWNPHLDRFGCVRISADDYRLRLAEALEADGRWS